jgi:hypothetical protein
VIMGLQMFLDWPTASHSRVRGLADRNIVLAFYVHLIHVSDAALVPQLVNQKRPGFVHSEWNSHIT